MVEARECSSLTIDQIPSSPYAFGIVCKFVSRFPPFKDYQFGSIVNHLLYQLDTSSHVIAGLDDRIVGYVGWIPTTRELAEAWLRADNASLLSSEKTDAVVVTVLVTEDKHYILPMIKHLKMLCPNHSCYWKRHFIDGRLMTSERAVRK